MDEQLQARYEASRSLLLDVLRVEGDCPAIHQAVSERWGTASSNPTVHMKLVAPFRTENYTFLLSHMEKGTSHTMIVPENVTLQCIAGRFRVLRDGYIQLIAAPHSVEIQAGMSYTYEAIEEVYNIMKLAHHENLG